MIRIAGAVLVAAGGMFLGLQAAAGLQSRVRDLRAMSAGLALLEQELELSAPPLSRLLLRGAARSEGPAQELFQRCAQGLDRLDQEEFSALWRRLTGELDSLGPEGRAILTPLGEVMGRCDALRQRERICAARGRLEELAGRLEADSRRQGKVYQALGLSCGAFLVILLL